MDSQHKNWNEQQKKLRQLFSRSEDHTQAIDLFLVQHAMVHSAAISKPGGVSFADDAWQDLSEEQIRCVPAGSEHSIAWIFWHVTRIEDITMNLVLMGEPQLFIRDGWIDRLGIPFQDTGNAMDKTKITSLSETIQIADLKAYRQEVGKRTRGIVKHLVDPSDLRARVDDSRLHRVLEEGAVVEGARWLLDYWGGLTHAGLLLMPPTRHNFVHLNEVMRLRMKLKVKSTYKVGGV
jgi:hypothetical protein